MVAEKFVEVLRECFWDWDSGVVNDSEIDGKNDKGISPAITDLDVGIFN